MRLLPAIIILLSACADFPMLDGTLSQAARDAPYPALTPVPAAPVETGADQAALQARVAALQAKAARIRMIDIAALQ